MGHRGVHLVGLVDCDSMVLVFNFAPVQLTGEGCVMCIRRVALRLKELCLDGKLLLCCNEVTRLELIDHCIDGLIIVTRVVLFELFHILRVDIRDDGFDRHDTYRPLKGLLLPVDILVLLGME